MQSTFMSNNAEDFLIHQSKENPEKFKEVAEKYPVNSKYAKNQIYHDPALGGLIDESPRRRDRRRKERAPEDKGVPKESRRRLSPEDYEDYRNNKSIYEKDWLEDYYKAKELADQGM